jgi:hypothetical protein
MSDIPDWLVELASQQSEGEPAEDESEWDFLRPQPTVKPRTAISEGPDFYVPPTVQPEPQVQHAAADATDLMESLRSQVEIEEPAELLPPRPGKSALDFRLAGLRPWQHLVLSIMVFLDVGVIGLLFLVMLGRIALP